METTSTILQQLSKIHRDSLTLRVTPSQIDSQLDDVQQLITSKDGGSHSVDRARAGEGRKRRGQEGGGRVGFTAFDLQASLHDPNIAEKQASDILATMGISLEKPLSLEQSIRLKSRSTNRSNRQSHKSYQSHQQVSSINQVANTITTGIGDGGSMLFLPDDGGSALLFFKEEEEGEEDKSLTMNVHAHEYLEEKGAHEEFEVANTSCSAVLSSPMNTSSSLSSSSSSSSSSLLLSSSLSQLSLPLIRTLNHKEQAQIARMPKPNHMERLQYEHIRSQYIESGNEPSENPYRKIKNRWGELKGPNKYIPLTEESSIISLTEMIHLDDEKRQEESCENKGIHDVESQSKLRTTSSSRLASFHQYQTTKDNYSSTTSVVPQSISTHGSKTLVPLEIVKVKKRTKKRMRIQPTTGTLKDLQNEQKKRSLEARKFKTKMTRKTRMNSSTLSTTTTTTTTTATTATTATTTPPLLFETSPSIILENLKIQSDFQKQKISAEMKLKMFSYRQQVPLELQGPTGCLHRVAAILKAANGRQVLQQRVNSFNHWRTMTELIKKKEKIVSAIKIQNQWRIKVAKKEWNERMDAAKRQKQRMFELQVQEKNQKDKAQEKIAKISRGYQTRLKYHQRKKKDMAAKCIQRAFRCKNSKKNLLLKIIKYNQIMESSTIIQCAWRCASARMQHAMLQRIHIAELHILQIQQRAKEYEYHFQTIGSAVVIQIWWKSCMLRLRAKYQIKAIKFRAANTCQRWWRGCFIRNGIVVRKKFKRQKRREVENAAAGKIQKLYRFKKSKNILQKILKTKNDLKKKRIHEKEMAAIRAQGSTTTEKKLIVIKKAGRFLFRNAKNIIAPNLKDKSALIIQCTWRTYEAKVNGVTRQKLFLKQRQHREKKNLAIKSMIKIQKIYRGYHIRLIYGSRKDNAARTIQTIFRLYHARQRFLQFIFEIRSQRKGASEIIQKFWRGKQCRASYLKKIKMHRKCLPATLVIQTKWRQYMGKIQMFKQLERKKKSMKILLLVKVVLKY